MELLINSLSGAKYLANARVHDLGIDDIEPVVKTCGVHGEYMATGKRVGTYDGPKELWNSCPQCGEERRREAQAKIEFEEKQKREQAMCTAIEKAGIPARFMDRSISTFKASSDDQKRALTVASDYVHDFIKHRKTGASLVFSGMPGTGKSHLALAILQGLMPATVGRYITCMDLVRAIRSTWRKDSESSETKVLNALINAPLLVIDEIGVQYGSDGEQTILFDVLDGRYREMNPTILVTNQNKDGFKQYVGDRIYDRMTECAKWVPFAWDSYRPQARKEMADA